MIPRHIFREYDIRGLHESELSDPVAESVGRAYAVVIARSRTPGEGGGPGTRPRVALGRDVRPSSERLAAAVERGMVAGGLDVERVGVVPTPALYQRALDEQEKKRQVLEATKTDNSWGNQIRSYVFQPYTMVNDHRTELKVGDVQKVMDGDLDPFIEAYLKRFAGGKR